MSVCNKQNVEFECHIRLCFLMGQLEVVVLCCISFTLCVMMGVVVGGVEAGASVRDNVVNDAATPVRCRLMSIPRGHPNATRKR